jgi:uncharacterized protein YndB with AHSA1/START domain
MPEVARSVEVDAPAEATWAAAVDWDRHGRWMLLTTIDRDEARAEGEGSRFTAVTGVRPVALRDPMRITVWRPPFRCEVRHEGRIVRGVAAFDIEPLPDRRSRFTWSEWVEPPFGVLGHVGFALTKPFFVLFVDVCLRRLARWVPSR